MGCSLLHYDLSYNVHVSNDPSCACGALLETAFHYFFECERYINERQILRRSIENITQFTLLTILFGDNNLEMDSNHSIFEAVHKYMNDTKRFL